MAARNLGLSTSSKSGVNDINPQAWLADVRARLPAHPAQQIDELLPWNGGPAPAAKDIAA